MPPRLKGIEPTPFVMPVSTRKRKRQWSVFWVVLCQLLKAEILFTIVAVTSGYSIATALPRSFLRPLIDLIIQRDIYEQDALINSVLWILLLTAICYTASGLGLLLKINGMRLISMAITGVEIIWLVFMMVIPAYMQQVQLPIQSQVFLIVVLLVDFLIIYSLVKNAGAFRGRN
jgi:hypothetical protein